MFQTLRSFFEAKNIQTRVIRRGVALTVVPLFLVISVIWIANGIANSVSVAGCYQLASQDLDRAVLGLLSACKLYQEDIGAALTGARVVLNRKGQIHFDSSQLLDWTAKNQFTSETIKTRLPLMKVGDTAIRPISEFGHEAPIVDEVQTLYKTSATIFQRMNEAGDMLRVSTTIAKADGSRAIGTFIPVKGADGKPNPVVATVLKGNTYFGRAFVVNSWYMAAYQPMKDEHGAVAGIIYTGLPEAQLRDKLLKFNERWGSAGKTDVFVVHTAAKAQGLFVISSDPTLQDHLAWNNRDAKGDLYIQAMCKQALKAPAGEILQGAYWTTATQAAPSEKMVVRFVYFPEWDWVIGVQQPERDFLALPTRIQRVFLVSNFVPLALAILAMIVALTIWKGLTGQLTAQVGQVLAKLQASSKQFLMSIQSIRGNSDSVGASANELFRTTHTQASSAEQTSATTGALTETAHRNSQAADRMRTLASQSETILDSAQKTLADVGEAMTSIHATNDQALTIIDTINDIGFATNIVALNASIEAAKAGDAGRTFAFIAEEVRQLAAKVATAAQDTRKVINNSRDEIERGNNFARKLVAALAPMNENAGQVRHLAVEVSTNSQSQADSMRQVLDAVEEIQKASHRSAQMAQRSTSDATDLRSQVESLAVSVEHVEQAINTLNEQFFSDSHPPGNSSDMIR